MNHNAIETILGAVVILVAGIFLAFALSAADMKKIDGYNLTANFSKINGISPGLDVRISGVKVGSVLKTELDPKSYLAKVTMSVKNDIKLSRDSVAKVSSEGLLGGKYLAIDPGNEDDMLKPGDQIQYTQAAVDLEEMIGKFIFSSADNKDDKKKGEKADAAASQQEPADPYAAAE